MEGITILNQFVVDNAPVGWFAIICGGVLLLVCLWAMFKFIGWNEIGYVSVFIILAFVCAGMTAVGIDVVAKPPETRYQILIDESVSMTEFFEKYEIIEQEGKIYTVKENPSNG